LDRTGVRVNHQFCVNPLQICSILLAGDAKGVKIGGANPDQPACREASGRMAKRRIRHVALVIDAANLCDRKIISGVASYVQEAGNWSLYVEEDPLQKLPDLDTWHGDGVIANLDDRTDRRRGATVPVVAPADLMV
jgi:hypothetical protein